VERILAALGLAAVVALAGFAIPAWVDYRSAEPEQPSRPVDAAPVRATVSSTPAATTATVTVEERPVTTAAPTAPAQADLRLVAARGDCWLDVRDGSADGPSLFAGILPQGSSRSFERRALWIEIGAPAALDVTLNGEAVEDLPQAPTTVVATASGVRPVAT
jgi:hypothetical protein